MANTEYNHSRSICKYKSEYENKTMQIIYQ